MRTLFRVTSALVVAGLAASAGAAEPKISPLITGLDNPCGVAIQPTTGDLFVSDSAAGRVIRYNPASGGKATNAITGFGQDIYGKGPMYKIGPLGLAFVNKDVLAVGGGGHKDGSELLFVYDVPPAGKAVKADAAKQKLGPIAPGEQSQMGEGNFYGLVADDKSVYITSNGDDTKGWILRADVGSEGGELKPFIATKVALEDTDAPVGICLSKEGNLVVGQMGEVSKPSDSLLTTYDAKSGKLLMRAATGLHDIAGLAYSPSGKLYAVDFAWIDAKQGGLFRLDVSEENGSASVKAVKIASLDKPTAIVFDKEGAAYVTVFGTAAEGSTKPAGQLLKITGDL